MTETLILALLVGAASGALFFLGLWWTVRKGISAENPALWFILSFILRILFAGSVFYWIAQLWQWQHLLIALFGFMLSRIALSRWVSSVDKTTQSEKHHAP